MLALVDQMGVSYDAAVLVLAEDLRQAYGGYGAAADDSGKDVARPDGGKLIRVPHKDKARIVRHGAQQRVHQQDIHHGTLVEDHRITVQPVVLTLGENHLFPVVVELCAEKAVDRGGLPAGQLGHALGGPAGRRCEQRTDAELVKEGEDRADGGRFTGAGAAGDNEDLVVQCHLQRAPLHGGVADLLLLFESCDQALRVRFLLIPRP